MSDPILKAHGAHAFGTISKDEDGRWRTSILIQDLEKEIQQQHGPEFFSNQDMAKDWILRHASHYDLKEGDIDIAIED